MAKQTIDLGPAITNGMLDMDPGSVDTVAEAFTKTNSNFTELYAADLWTLKTIGTLADDATPSVLGGSVWLTGGTTTITDFDDGVTGQIITILSEHAVTITDGTNIILNGSANFVMASTDSLTLICKADNKWYELSRMVNL